MGVWADREEEGGQKGERVDVRVKGRLSMWFPLPSTCFSHSSTSLPIPTPSVHPVVSVLLLITPPSFPILLFPFSSPSSSLYIFPFPFPHSAATKPSVNIYLFFLIVPGHVSSPSLIITQALIRTEY